MKQVFALFVLSLVIMPGYSQETLKVSLPNGEQFEHEVVYKQKDSVKGIIAVFASDTGQIAFSGFYVNGKPNGRFLYYRPNGEYRQTMIYGYGKLHGDYTVYGEKGKILVKGKYKEGQKHGFWIDKKLNLMGRYRLGKRHRGWKQVEHGGKKILEKWFFYNGKLRNGDPKTAAKLTL